MPRMVVYLETVTAVTVDIEPEDEADLDALAKSGSNILDPNATLADEQNSRIRVRIIDAINEEGAAAVRSATVRSAWRDYR